MRIVCAYYEEERVHRNRETENLRVPKNNSMQVSIVDLLSRSVGKSFKMRVFQCTTLFY